MIDSWYFKALLDIRKMSLYGMRWLESFLQINFMIIQTDCWSTTSWIEPATVEYHKINWQKYDIQPLNQQAHPLIISTKYFGWTLISMPSWWQAAADPIGSTNRSIGTSLNSRWMWFDGDVHHRSLCAVHRALLAIKERETKTQQTHTVNRKGGHTAMWSTAMDCTCT